MDEQDAFFTHAVVGPPFSVLLGRRMSAAAGQAQGLQIDPADGDVRVSPAWQPWVIERLSELPPGVPRRRPKAWRRWVERHALGIALLGALALLGGAGLSLHALGGFAQLNHLVRSLPW
ncbi:hypothetical protein [Hydrogenophaga sp. T2]|uniref:hypothetical protein n=1 Tax=Hydrogenophaga sp. T2 TaxID=3132823 RepID=UPI003CF99028